MRFFIVSSLDEDIQILAQKYSKEMLIEKLYALLNIPASDLYANALLYDLIDNRKLGKLLSINREKWIVSRRGKADAGVWKEYIQKNIYTY